MQNDYYNILGVKRDASEKDIKTAFKKLSLKYHPDRMAGKSENEKTVAESKFKEINEAYQVLSDPAKKSHYDVFGTMDGYNPDGPKASAGDPFSGFGFNPFGFGGMGGTRRQAAPGSDVRVNIPITIEDLYNGVHKSIKFKKKVRCRTCHGEGGTGIKNCPHCKGTGMITISNRTPFGYMQQSTPCDHCKGTGKIVSHKCPTCGGSGLTDKQTTVEIDFEKGIVDGGGYAMRGQGNESRDRNGANGQLFVLARYNLGDDYRVENQDVYHTVRIPYYDCLLGTKFDEKLPNKEVRKIVIPECTKSGTRIRLTNDGIVSDDNGFARRQGDYYIVIDYAIPEKLSQQDREAVAKIKINNELIEVDDDENEPTNNHDKK